jgi:hypothetical protein
MSAVAEVTPGNLDSCFSTADVHEMPHVMPSTKKTTVDSDGFSAIAGAEAVSGDSTAGLSATLGGKFSDDWQPIAAKIIIKVTNIKRIVGVPIRALIESISHTLGNQK